MAESCGYGPKHYSRCADCAHNDDGCLSGGKINRLRNLKLCFAILVKITNNNTCMNYEVN